MVIFNGKIRWNLIKIFETKRTLVFTAYRSEKIVRLRLVFTPSAMVVETENRGCSDV